MPARKARVYRVVNSEDEMVYIGSTKQLLPKRWESHKTACRVGINYKVYQHMRTVGVDKFRIELICEQEFATRKEQRQVEQEEIQKIPVDRRLNVLAALAVHPDRRLDLSKKKASRMAYYYRRKADPTWIEKERERNRLRMAKKRDGVRD
jgi:hypothetical protein